MRSGYRYGVASLPYPRGLFLLSESVCATPAPAPSPADPFADTHACQDFVADALPPPRAASRAAFVHYSTPAAYAYPTPPAPRQQDNRTAKLVASVLLNRSGRARPMRGPAARRPGSAYVRSGLSVCVAAEA